MLLPKGPGRLTAPGLLSILVTFLAPIVQAAPFMPTSDNQVIERLQPRKGPLWDEVRLQRSRLEGAPDSAAPRLAIARTYLQIHQGTGDPRFLGYAEAALLPWAHSSTAPIDVSLVRVHLLQAQHQFDKAGTLLDEILTRDSRQPDAWLQVASISQLRGDFTAARRACAHLIALGEPDIASGCLAAVQGMTGASAAGLDLLARQLAADAEPAPAISIWLRTLSAELATGLQRYPEAEEQFRRALRSSEQELGQSNVYLLTACADLLLEQGRYAAVVELLSAHTGPDSTLLRLARAEQQLGLPDRRRHVSELAARMAALVERGDRTHGREQAYFALYLQHDAHAALALAVENWAQQREVIDARLVLDAARSAGAPRAADPVREWIRASGLVHAWLRS